MRKGVGTIRVPYRTFPDIEASTSHGYRNRRLKWIVFVVVIGAIMGVEIVSHSSPKQALSRQVHKPVSLIVSKNAGAEATGNEPFTLITTPGRLPRPPVIRARAAILIDASSGEILYAHNPMEQLPMASCTKLMTAILFCERVPNDAVIIASKRAASTPESSMHLKPGERLSAHDLLRAMLLRSANDGCVAAAEKAAGSVEAFVQLMNQKAALLGCTHTHFENPHGLTAPGHYTTAHDLAIIARTAMQTPRIRNVVKLRYSRIQRSIDKRDDIMRNHTHFVGHFPGADGIKTGWTIPAGHCFVGSVTRNGWELISVELHSPSFVKETERLMNYGFTHFQPHLLAVKDEALAHCKVHDGITPTVPAAYPHKLEITLPIGKTGLLTLQPSLDSLNAPVPAGTPVGKVDVLLNGRPILSRSLIALQPDPSRKTSAPSHFAGIWKHLLSTCFFLGIGLVSLRYVTGVASFTKSARRSRSRFAQSMRRDNHSG